MCLLRVPGATPGGTQPVHHSDQVQQPRPRNVIGPDEDLDLRWILTTADLGGQGVGQAWVAICGTDPNHLAILGPVDQQTSKSRRLMLAKGSGRNAGLLYGVPLRFVLIPGQDVGRTREGGPGVAREE